MSESNNTEAIRSWFRACDALVAGTRFNADFVAGRSTEYAIYSVPSSLNYKKNILGDEVLANDQTQNFIFAAELPYGEDARQNLANLGFMQTIMNWVITQNAARNFPDWDGGSVKSILPTQTSAPVRVGGSSAKYQFQIKVDYRRA